MINGLQTDLPMCLAIQYSPQFQVDLSNLFFFRFFGNYLGLMGMCYFHFFLLITIDNLIPLSAFHHIGLWA